jgi:flagellar motor switch protein FliG
MEDVKGISGGFIKKTAFGPEKGEEIVARAATSSQNRPFAFFDGFSAEQVALLLKEETAAAAALVLSRLEAKLSAAVLKRLPRERTAGVVRRIARQGEVSPEVLERVAAVLRDKARLIAPGGGDGGRINGMKILAAILKNGDFSFTGRIIDELEAGHPGLGGDIREGLYTLDDIAGADSRAIGDKLGTMTLSPGSGGPARRGESS